MAENELLKVKVKKKKKIEKIGFNWFFWISFVIILIPCCYFVWLLLSASKDSNTPILGQREEHSIETKIEDSQISSLASEIKTIEGVESAEVNLNVLTVRISIKANDSLTKQQIETVLNKAYEVVNRNLSIDTYFTSTDDYKQYDLEISVYNNLNTDNTILIQLVKNGHMDEYKISVLSEPVNKELADSLKNPNKDENKGNSNEADDEIYEIIDTETD